MRRIALALLLLIPLAGCGSDPESSYADEIAKVQEYAQQICNFLPHAKSVAAMLTADNPVVTGAFAVATAICNAVTGKPMGLYSDRYTEETCPKVNGICIEGEFVDPEKKDEK